MFPQLALSQQWYFCGEAGVLNHALVLGGRTSWNSVVIWWKAQMPPCWIRFYPNQVWILRMSDINARVQNLPLRPKPTSQSNQSELSICCAVYKFHSAMTQQQTWLNPLGPGFWDGGLNVVLRKWTTGKLVDGFRGTGLLCSVNKSLLVLCDTRDQMIRLHWGIVVRLYIYIYHTSEIQLMWPAENAEVAPKNRHQRFHSLTPAIPLGVRGSHLGVITG